MSSTPKVITARDGGFVLISQKTGRHRAFTLLELLVVSVITLLLVGLILPSIHPFRRRNPSIKCVNNLKNVGLSFRIFATDNGGKFPMQLSTNQGGLAEFKLDPSATTRVFKCLSNELSTPKILICNSDRRIEATNFSTLTGQNVSYFIGWNSSEMDTTSFLAGDRQMGTSKSVTNASLAISSNNAASLRWVNGPHNGIGNVCLGDGSVQQLSDARLRQAGKSLAVTNVLLFP